jgi:hypothetical protein
LFASAAFAVLNVSPAMLAMAAHATHFVVCPVLGGLLLVDRAIQTRKVAWLAAAGVCFGLAVMVRQPAVFFGIFAFGAWLAGTIRTAESSPWRRSVAGAAVFPVAAALPLLLLIAWVCARGAWPRFSFWTWEYAASYGSLTTLKQGWANLLWALPRVSTPNLPLCVLAVVGVFRLFREGTFDSKVWFGGLLISSALAVAAGLYFRHHYFIQILPLLALACGIAAGGVGGSGAKSRRHWIYQSLGAAAVVVTIALQSNWLFRLKPEDLSRSLYGVNPFPETQELSRYIRKNTSPTDTIAVLGSEPQVYAYTQRRSASGYIYMYALMEPTRFAASMQREMIQDIERARPKFILIADAAESWLDDAQSEKLLFEWVSKYIATYELICRADITSSGTRYLWGADAERQPQGGRSSLILLRRK